jgi:hypothetical protein
MIKASSDALGLLFILKIIMIMMIIMRMIVVVVGWKEIAALIR